MHYEHNLRKYAWLFIVLTLAVVALMSEREARMDTFQLNIPVGIGPGAIAINEVTNKVYIANSNDTVTVINGADNTTATVSVGDDPGAIAVNAATNKIYVTNRMSKNVTVINGADNTTATVPIGEQPGAIAVNAATNKIYVAANWNVTVINGADNTTATVPVGRPWAIAVNQMTNKIYVATFDINLTVINGADNTTATVPVGSQPWAIAVNQVTNKIYVANLHSNNVTVISGADNTTATVPTGGQPMDVAVNEVTNKIYVANTGVEHGIYVGATVTVINGADNNTATVRVLRGAIAIEVNPVTNEVYVACQETGTNDIIVIYGADNTTATVAAGSSPKAIAVNPATNKIYVANYSSDNVTVINGDNPAINDPPSFTKGPDHAPTSAGPQSVANWATNISTGGPDESGQMLTFEVTSNTNTALFSAGPAISSTGTLTYTPAAHVSGKAMITVTLKDNGGTANGGQDTSGPQSFWITTYDWMDYTTATVPVGTDPEAIAVNPVTNKIYVANYSSANVTVINGADNTTTTIPVVKNPMDMAVNPVTNKVYVVGSGVTVINGDNTTATVPAGGYKIAVNTVTNKIYVANPTGVTVINGANNTTTTIWVGGTAIAINEITNKIYLANDLSGNVTVINGDDNSTTKVVVGSYANAIAVNPVTNKIYVAICDDSWCQNGSVAVIDGVDNTKATVKVGPYSGPIVVNEVTNKIYVSDRGYPGGNHGPPRWSNLTVIDGADNSTAGVPEVDYAQDIAVNQATDKIYVINREYLYSHYNLIVINDYYHTTAEPIPTGSGPRVIAVNQVTNNVYIANYDSDDVTVIKVVDNTITTVSSSSNPSDLNQSVAFTAAVVSAPVRATGTVQFKDNGSPMAASITLNADGVATLTTSTLMVGTHTITADYSGDANLNASTGTLTGGQIVRPPPSLSVNDASITEGDSGTKTMSFTIGLSAASNFTVKANFASAAGTATTPSDYGSNSETLTFNPGEITQSANVTINGDQLFEPDETFTVSLSNPVNATIGKAQGTGTIQNDDAQGGFISFSQANYSVSKSGGSLTITIKRTNDTSRAVTVDYATDDTGAPALCATISGMASSRCDFTTAMGTLRFAPGETEKTFTVLVNPDSYVEGSELFTANLSNLTSGAALATPSSAIVTITDIPATPPANLIDDANMFVRQHYHDFLNREPDAEGLAFWTNQITSCGADAQCLELKRINVSASFFLSIEFQETGGTAYLTNKTAFGGIVAYSRFERDAQALGRDYVFTAPGSAAVLEANKVAYFNEFVNRPEFVSAYGHLSNEQYVDALAANTGINFTEAECDAMVKGMDAGTETFATVLRQITEKQSFRQAELNRLFVLLEYFSYLRRNPNDAPDFDYAGYQFWMNKLDRFNGNFIDAEMVKAFISSIEYRQRFGP